MKPGKTVTTVLALTLLKLDAERLMAVVTDVTHEVQREQDTLVRRLRAHWAATQPDLVVSLIPNFNRALFDSLAQERPGVPYVTVLTDPSRASLIPMVIPACRPSAMIALSSRPAPISIAICSLSSAGSMPRSRKTTPDHQPGSPAPGSNAPLPRPAIATRVPRSVCCSSSVTQPRLRENATPAALGKNQEPYRVPETR